jgi:hypothetical protein
MSTRTVISHWQHLIENFNTSSMEFYNLVVQAMERRRVPESEVSQVDWRESGMFSAKREYLRLRRGRYIFDICGAPFGTGFFVSWWLTQVRPSPAGPTVLAFFMSGLLSFVLTSTFGAIEGTLTLVILWVVGFFVVGAFVSQGESVWADYVMAILVFGWLIERIFRPVTYFRIDTALMFQATVGASVHEVVDEITRARGGRPLSEFERKPIMREFFSK